ncbi:MAG: YhdH/YhfP family quinone oxidoreductase [Desulfobacteraceae bacterium]|nr:YhdH/YhfP family quinone oxidoreductase [Desulfobacteraceae bacterium]
MTNNTYRSMVVSQTDNGRYQREITAKRVSELPEGDVLIRVNYSSLNYKDALSAVGNKGVTRNYPHTPGIDAAGVVEACSDGSFPLNAQVLVTGYDLGMNTSGGFGQYIRVPSDWVVPLPSGLSERESMIFGTAGFTAAMSVYRLASAGVTPDRGDILVTGATGGVGSLAVAILATAGYKVAAVSGKKQAAAFLKELGATDILPREALADSAKKPLLEKRWMGVVDTVGGDILSTAIKSTHQRGVVTCCGLVASPKLNLTVFPFILRGVSLFGIDSASCPMAERKTLWYKLANEWKPLGLERIASEINLMRLDENIAKILEGQQIGRKIINLNS